MPNKNRGYVTIAAGGKDRPLRYSLNAMAELEERLQVGNMIDLLSVDFNSFRVIRCFIIVGLMDADPELSEEDAKICFRDMDADIDEVGKKLLEALTLAGIIREVDAGGDNDPPLDRPSDSSGTKLSA